MWEILELEKFRILEPEANSAFASGFQGAYEAGAQTNIGNSLSSMSSMDGHPCTWAGLNSQSRDSLS